MSDLAKQAALPAKIGMGLAIVSGGLLLAAMLVLKSMVRAFGLADGKDDHDSLAWLWVIAKMLVPIVVYFFIYLRLKRKAVRRARLGTFEMVIYAVVVIGSLAPLWPNFAGSITLVIVAFPALLTWAIWLNQKL